MDALYKRCLTASAAFHVGLLVLGNARLGLNLRLPPPERVIDLTLPLGLRDSPPPGKLGRPGLPTPSPVPVPAAPSLGVPAAPPPAPPVPAAAPTPVPDPRPAAPEPEPAPPVPTAPAVPGAAPGVPNPMVGGSNVLGNPSGSAAGDPTATGGGGTGPGSRSARPQVLPRLLNKDEVLANLRRFYPEAERRAGRESKVLVKLRVGTTGTVEGVDVLTSGGAAFDAAARAVAERMRFSPAKLDGEPVAVGLPQLIIFKLE